MNLYIFAIKGYTIQYYGVIAATEKDAWRMAEEFCTWITPDHATLEKVESLTPHAFHIVTE